MNRGNKGANTVFSVVRIARHMNSDTWYRPVLL